MACPSNVGARRPVAQAPHGRALAPTLRFGAGDDGGLGGLHLHAVQEIRIDERARPCIGLVNNGRITAIGRYDAGRGEHIFAREVKVTLVMRGNGHHRTGAIFHQHEIGDEQRQLGASERVDHRDASVIAHFLLRLDLRRRGAGLAAFVGKGGELGVTLGEFE